MVHNEFNFEISFVKMDVNYFMQISLKLFRRVKVLHFIVNFLLSHRNVANKYDGIEIKVEFSLISLFCVALIARYK